MKKKLANTALIVAAVVSLAVLAFYVRIGATADSIAVLKTSGMTCGSCSGKISQALETVKGVAATEVDVEGGWVIVGYDTKAVKPEALAEKVKDAGFGSTVQQLLTPEQYKQMTGVDFGRKGVRPGGCGGCGTKNGCGANSQK